MRKIDLLLVDDERDFRDATSRALIRRGFNVREAASGEEALQIVATAAPDILILDLRMTGIDGIETLERLRKIDVELPVVILTGQGTLDDAVAGIQLGIVDFVRKPVDIDQLSCRLRALLQRGAREQLRERTVAELMVPASAYRRVREDQRFREVLRELKVSLAQIFTGELTEQGHRSVLVYDRDDRFLGVLTLGDLLAHVLPPALRGSPYASYLTGMFIAQCKLLGDAPVSELLERRRSIDRATPLMEALDLMVGERLINLPVVEDGELVGVLRDKDLLFEVANIVNGGA